MRAVGLPIRGTPPGCSRVRFRTRRYTSAVARAQDSQERSFSVRRRPNAPMRSARPRSESDLTIPFARAASSPGGTSIPSLPGRTSSRSEPTAEATTGPQRRAMRRTPGCRKSKAKE